MKFSIITINLDNHAGLIKTIESVVNQTFTEFEFIIIDGGSTDGSKEIIEAFTPKLSYWVSEPDRGIYHAMNKGIEKSSGEYLLFLNSGDFLVDNNVLEKVSISRTSADILLGDCSYSKNGKVIFTAISPEELTLRNFFHQTIPHQASFIKRRLFKDYGLYDESYKILSDLDFWLITIILKNCSVQRLNILVSDYNLDGTSCNQKDLTFINDEYESIFSKHIPSRITKDYESYQKQLLAMRKFSWFEGKSYLTWIVSISFDIAKILSNAKKLTKNNLINLSSYLHNNVIKPFKSSIISLIVRLRFTWKLYYLKPVIILVWHQISSEFIKGINIKEIWTSTSDFEKSINYLLRKKFIFISLKQAIEILNQTNIPQKRYVVFTFDDGYSTLNETIPILEKYNIPATFFINSAYLDNNKVNWIDINNLIEFAKDPNSIPGAVKASIQILYENCSSDYYDYFRTIAENSYSKISLKDNTYILRDQLFAIQNSLFTIALHGHEHELHTKMSQEWIIQNIEQNYAQLKSHPNFEPYIAFPFGLFQKEEVEYWESRGFRTLTCDSLVNYGKSTPFHRIAFDGEVVSNKSLARLSGENFSFKRLLNLE